MTEDSSIDDHHSPPSSPGVQSPRNRLRWSQIVLGCTEEPVPNTPSSSSSQLISASEPATLYSDNSDLKVSPDKSAAAETKGESSDSSNDNVDRSNKPAWNKPLNGVVEVGTVMGDAVSWPALSESTRPTPKSSPVSSKPSSNKSISVSQEPIISHSPEKESNGNPNPNFTPNNTMSVRQRSTKRGGGTVGGSSQSGFKGPPPPPPPPPPLPLQYPVFGTPYGNLVRQIPDSPVREPLYQCNNWDARLMPGVGPHSYASNYHFSQLSSSGRSNFGVRPRGDGLHHGGYGGRRDRYRGGNGPRGSNPRYVHMQHQMAPPPPPPPRGFITSPPPASTPQPGIPVGNHMGLDMASQIYYVPTMPPDSFRVVPFLLHASPQSSYFPVVNPLQTQLINQIDYYFSDDNLVKDNFLRLMMDDQGWVPITLIAKFPRVKLLTSNIPLILDFLRASTIVEVKAGMVRRRNEWRKWIPATKWVPTDSGLKPPGESTDNILAMATLKDVTTNQNGAVDAHTEETDVNGEDTAEDAGSEQI